MSGRRVHPVRSERLETFEASRPDWEVGDPVIVAGNRHFRVTSTIPLEWMAEVVDAPEPGSEGRTRLSQVDEG
jgi:hypothetical protein